MAYCKTTIEIYSKHQSSDKFAYYNSKHFKFTTAQIQRLKCYPSEEDEMQTSEGWIGHTSKVVKDFSTTGRISVLLWFRNISKYTCARERCFQRLKEDF